MILCRITDVFSTIKKNRNHIDLGAVTRFSVVSDSHDVTTARKEEQHQISRIMYTHEAKQLILQTDSFTFRMNSKNSSVPL